MPHEKLPQPLPPPPDQLARPKNSKVDTLTDSVNALEAEVKKHEQSLETAIRRRRYEAVPSIRAEIKKARETLEQARGKLKREKAKET